MLSTRLRYVVIGLSLVLWGIYSLLPTLGLESAVFGYTSQGTDIDKVVAAGDGIDKQVVGEVRDLREMVGQLKSRVASLEKRLQLRQMNKLPVVSSNNPVNEGVEQTGVASDNELEESSLSEREQEHWEEYLSLVETHLQNENIDSQWSEKAKTEIENTFASDELASAAVTEIECRSTLCRIEVAHDEPQSLSEFDVLLPQKLAHILPQTTMDRVELEDGSTQTIVYLSRDGFDFPKLESRQ